MKHCQGDRPSSGHRGLLWSHACVWLMHVGRGETTNPRMMAGGQLRRVGGTGMIIAHALGEGTPFVPRIVGRVWRAWGPRLEMGVAHVSASMAGRRSHGEACSIPPTKYGKEVSVERLASPSTHSNKVSALTQHQTFFGKSPICARVRGRVRLKRPKVYEVSVQGRLMRAAASRGNVRANTVAGGVIIWLGTCAVNILMITLRRTHQGNDSPPQLVRA